MIDSTLSSRAGEASPVRAGAAARWTGSSAVVALIVLVWLCATLGLRGLSQPDEGRYIGVAYEMLRSGDWIVPTLNGLPFFHKPPLFYWISAGSMSVFGLHDWAGRIPSMLGAFAASLMLFRFTRRWSGVGTARTTLFVLVTQPGLFIGAQYANLDMLVAGCMSVTILAAAEAVLITIRADAASGASVRRWVLGMWLAAAFGVLAKGLIGIVLPGITVLVWLCLMRRPKLVMKLLWWPGPLLFLLVAGPWFVAMQLRFPEFFDYFVVEQHFRRFTGEHTFNNVHPFWFFVPVLALIGAPWSLWLMRIRQLREHRLPGSTAEATRQLMWVWMAVIVGFFSLPASKLVGYIFAALPPLAWLVGDVLSRDGISAMSGSSATADEPGRWRLTAWKACAMFAIVFCLGLTVGGSFYQPRGAGEIADRIASSRTAGEPIIMLDKFIYDLEFATPLREGIPVVGNWSDPDLANHDNWRKELVDAGRFAPAAAAQVLIDRHRAEQIVCGAQVSWLIGSASHTASEYPMLAGSKPSATSGDAVLWKLDRRDPATEAAVQAALDCGKARP